MTDERAVKSFLKKRGVGILLKGGAILLLLLAAAYVLLWVYLGTPSAAARFSRLATGVLHQPATVARLELRGGSLVVVGLTVESPAGFEAAPLFSSRSIMITPAWGELLAGRRSLALLKMEGLRVRIGKNRAGVWNFAHLAKGFTGRKGAAETFIERVVLEDASFTVNGRGVDNLSLTVNDFSTKGSTGSRLFLTCKDKSGSPIRLEGVARLGPTPSLNLSLSAPSVSLKEFRKGNAPLDLTEGRGTLFLSARLLGDELTVMGKVECDRLAFRMKQGRLPLAGELDFLARYEMGRDEAILDRCSLRINRDIRVQARARVLGVKKEKSFTAEISWLGMEVKELFAQLPREMRGDLAPEGRLVPRVLRLAGDGRQGITAASGVISLRGGGVTKGGRVLVKNLAVDAILTGGASGWGLRGRLFQGKEEDGSPLQGLDAPFSARFSSRLRPLQLEVSSLTARLMGVPLTGAAVYRPAAANPFSALLELSRLPLSSLNRYLAGKGVSISQGTASASLQADGRGPGEFQGKMRVSLHGLQGVAGGKGFALRTMATDASMQGSKGRVLAAGNINVGGGIYNGRTVGASCAYTLAAGTLALVDGNVQSGRTTMTFAEIRGAVPPQVVASGGKGLPVRIQWRGMDVKGDGAGVSGLAGNLNAELLSAPGRRWLEGTGAVAANKLILRGGEIGTLVGQFRFTDRGATAVINGRVLEGEIAGSVNIDPLAPGLPAGFSLHLTGMQAAGLSRFSQDGQGVKVASGLIDASLAGSYSATGGVRCKTSATGRGFTLTGGGGKSLLTDGGFKVEGELADGTFFLREGVISTGKSLALRLTGEVARVNLPDRNGKIAFSLAATPLDSLFDAFINLMPRPLQEARVAGTMAASGKVSIQGKKIVLDGEGEFTNALLEVPAQKLSVADVRGRIPFSVDLSGAAAASPREGPSFTRKNYAALLSTLRQGGGAGRTFAIGKIRFGAMEFGETTLVLRAGNGLTEVTSMRSALSEGHLLGKAFFSYGNGPLYGSDILVNDLSLRAFCDAYPAIKGYISGRLDGIISLRGKGKGINGLAGFVDLWTRSGKGEKMLVSKEFLQKLAGKKLKGLFFREDRPYDHGEISAYLEQGYLTFEVLDISHTTIFGIRDLGVSVAPVQNRIAVEHLFTAIKEAATRGKKVQGGEAAPEAPPETEFKWQE